MPPTRERTTRCRSTQRLGTGGAPPLGYCEQCCVNTLDLAFGEHVSTILRGTPPGGAYLGDSAGVWLKCRSFSKAGLPCYAPLRTGPRPSNTWRFLVFFELRRCAPSAEGLRRWPLAEQGSGGLETLQAAGPAGRAPWAGCTQATPVALSGAQAAAPGGTCSFPW